MQPSEEAEIGTSPHRPIRPTLPQGSPLTSTSGTAATVSRTARRPPPRRGPPRLLRPLPASARTRRSNEAPGAHAAVERMQLWATSYDREQREAEETLELARELFVRTVVNRPDGGGVGGGEETHPSPLRTAVSCLLLERICAVFTRYHSVLNPVANIIMRSIYVPDVPEMREVLGGTVEMPLRIPPGMPDAEVLLQPYARKPYFVAFDELTAGVVKFARANRSTEVRLSRQTKVFDSTVKHWMSSLVRNYFGAWRVHTRRRNQLREKYRAIFSRLRTDESKVRAIRRWRDRAGHIKRMAAVDAASATELHALRSSAQKVQESITHLGQYNASLGAQVAALEEERTQLQTRITETERQHSELVQRCNEMERVGNELLDTALVRHAPPAGAGPLEALVNWAHEMIEDAGGMVDGSARPLLPLLRDEFVVEVRQSALATVMLSFNSEQAPSQDSVVQMHMFAAAKNGAKLVEMYETLTGTVSLVNAEQLDSMRRGVQLLFLAGLLRFQTHWLLCKPPRVPRSRVAIAAPQAATAAPVMGDWTAWPERVKLQQQWITLGLSALHSALDVALHHPHQMSNEEQDDLPKFLSIPSTKLADMLPGTRADEIYVELFRTLNRLYPDIRKVYYAYAIPQLTYLDLLRLMKDCKVIGERRLSKKMLEIAALQVLIGSDYNPGSALAADLVSKVFSPSQFVEVLVRVALLNHRRITHDVADELSVPMVSSFISESVVPHALRSDVDRFKQAFRHPLVQQVISKNKISLRRAFGKFANHDNNESMDRQAFYAMARDCRWHTKTVTQESIAEIFNRCQSIDSSLVMDAVAANSSASASASTAGSPRPSLLSATSTGSGHAAATTVALSSIELLDLNEWLEAICAVCMFHDPNPFAPLHVKLAPFLDDRIFAPLGL